MPVRRKAANVQPVVRVRPGKAEARRNAHLLSDSALVTHRVTEFWICLLFY